ncbi:hypothetical protein IPH25_00115 [bacterium]|nr:MAG: hypothetical protein IPG37_02230 [bacterium]QQR61838.1 MAG: hypothetical protein IPH25_00115 [bacterium]QQR62580.1 MAG: hypothetical protein IPH67_04140 [bacterium]
MKMLEALEDRVNQLVNLSIELGKQKKNLEKVTGELKAEIESLKSENVQLAEDNAFFSSKLKALEAALESDSKELSSLTEEKSLAKLVVDDLIKSIDALMESEDLR